MNEFVDPVSAIDAYLDAELGDEQFVALQSWIDEHPEAAAELLADRAFVHSRLMQMLGDRAVALKSSADDSSALRGVGRAIQQSIDFFRRPTPLSLTVSALLLGALLTAMAYLAPPVYQRLRGPGTAGGNVGVKFVAQVTDSFEPEWAVGQVGVARGSHLVAGQRMKLERGLAELTFRSGAKTVLAGPCEFIVGTDRSGSLLVGDLTAEVPPQAIGFAITTPTSTIVDLGTRFGVKVDDEGTEVHVFDGVVEAKLLGESTGAFRLSAGNAARIDPVTLGVTHIPSRRSQFENFPAVEFSEAIVDDESDVLNSGRLVLASNFGKDTPAELSINGVAFAAAGPTKGWTEGGGDFSIDTQGGLKLLMTGLAYRQFGAGSLTFPTEKGARYRLQLFFDNDVNDSGDGQMLLLLGKSFHSAAPRHSAPHVVRVSFVALGEQTRLELRNQGPAVILNALCLHQIDRPEAAADRTRRGEQ